MLAGAETGQRLLFTAVTALLGFFLPVVWLGGRIRKRQDEIVKTLPDALDLLTISVEAGLPFDGAMQRVAEKWDNEISRGFQRMLRDARRQDPPPGFAHMAERMEVPDITSFVAALVQADQLGISIAKVLESMEQMRIKRRSVPKSTQAPIKCSFHDISHPTILIVILGPAIIMLKGSAIGES